MDLLCIDFTKVDPTKDGKENILVLTDTFTKFSQPFDNTKPEGTYCSKNIGGQMVLCIMVFPHMNS